MPVVHRYATTANPGTFLLPPPICRKLVQMPTQGEDGPALSLAPGHQQKERHPTLAFLYNWKPVAMEGPPLPPQQEKQVVPGTPITAAAATNTHQPRLPGKPEQVLTAVPPA